MLVAARLQLEREPLRRAWLHRQREPAVGAQALAAEKQQPRAVGKAEGEGVACARLRVDAHALEDAVGRRT